MLVLPRFNIKLLENRLRKRQKLEAQNRRLHFFHGTMHSPSRSTQLLPSAKIPFRGVADDIHIIVPAQTEFMDLYQIFKKALSKRFPGTTFGYDLETSYLVVPGRSLKGFVNYTGAVSGFEEELEKVVPKSQRSLADWISQLTESQMDQFYENHGGPILWWLRPFTEPRDAASDPMIEYSWPLDDAWRALRSL